VSLLPIHYDYFQPLAPQLAMGRYTSSRIGIDPFRHAEARGLAERGIIDVGNHWATTDHIRLLWHAGVRSDDGGSGHGGQFQPAMPVASAGRFD